MPKTTPITAQRQSREPQPIDKPVKFASQVPVIESVSQRIAYRWSQGALESSLSIEYRMRRAFIEAVLRREYNRMRAEVASLRMGRAA